MRRGYGPGGRNGRGRLAALVIAGLLAIIIVLLVLLWQLAIPALADYRGHQGAAQSATIA